jgi:hypothetical protein
VSCAQKLTVVCLLYALASTSTISSIALEEPLQLHVEVKEGLLSVQVGKMLLEDVLRQVAEQANLQIHTRGDLGQVRPQAFEEVPLEDGIRRLVGDNRVSLMMRYDVDEAGARRVAEILAYQAGVVPAELLEERRMLSELRRITPPPPPPPPPAAEAPQ